MGNLEAERVIALNDPQLSSNRLHIRRATAADAAVLAELAERTFRETFAADNPPDDMAIHVGRSYGQAIQLAELNDPVVTCLLGEIDGRPVAYAQLRDGAVPECVTGPRPYEIWRFYIDQPWIGHGIAQQLMNCAIAQGKSLSKQTLWLGVWEKNPRAIAFYKKCGFTFVGEHPFLFAHQLQTDLVMAREI